MKQLSEILLPGLVKLDLVSTDKWEMFEEMISLFVEQGVLSDRTEAMSALRSREMKMPTDVVPGVAFPHGKLAGIGGVTAALGISQKGIDYESSSHTPVKVVLMVFSELGNPGPHLRLLSEVSQVFENPSFRQKLQSAGSVEDVIALVAQA